MMARDESKNMVERKQIEQQEAAKRAKAEYARNWRARNPEKNRAYIERYWIRRAERTIASQKGEE